MKLSGGVKPVVFVGNYKNFDLSAYSGFWPFSLLTRGAGSYLGSGSRIVFVKKITDHNNAYLLLVRLP